MESLVNLMASCPSLNYTHLKVLFTYLDQSVQSSIIEMLQIYIASN